MPRSFLHLERPVWADTKVRADSIKTDLIPVIDVHTHSDFSNEKERSSNITMSEEQYLRGRKEANVVAAVHLTGQNGSGFRDLSKLNVIRCYGVGKESINKQKLEKELKDKNYKCFKIYLGYVHLFANSPHYQPIYQLARKHKIPVIFHTGDIYTAKGKLKYSDPLTIDEVAVDYPDVKFVIAHLGNPWIQSAAEVAYKNPNVYVEASALLIGKIETYPKEQIDEYMVKPIQWAFGYIENPKKFLFGTDWPLVAMKPYLDAYKRAIPRENWCDVFFRNATEVFDFPDEIKNLECK